MAVGLEGVSILCLEVPELDEQILWLLEVDLVRADRVLPDSRRLSKFVAHCVKHGLEEFCDLALGVVTFFVL